MIPSGKHMTQIFVLQMAYVMETV